MLVLNRRWEVLTSEEFCTTRHRQDVLEMRCRMISYLLKFCILPINKPRGQSLIHVQVAEFWSWYLLRGARNSKMILCRPWRTSALKGIAGRYSSKMSLDGKKKVFERVRHFLLALHGRP